MSTVHVGQVQTEVSGPGSTSGTSGGSGGGGTDTPEARPPGAAEDAWRRTEAEVARLRHRVAAEAFDD